MHFKNIYSTPCIHTNFSFNLEIVRFLLPVYRVIGRKRQFRCACVYSDSPPQLLFNASSCVFTEFPRISSSSSKARVWIMWLCLWIKSSQSASLHIRSGSFVSFHSVWMKHVIAEGSDQMWRRGNEPCSLWTHLTSSQWAGSAVVLSPRCCLWEINIWSTSRKGGSSLPVEQSPEEHKYVTMHGYRSFHLLSHTRIHTRQQPQNTTRTRTTTRKKAEGHKSIAENTKTSQGPGC